jgi:hypothetical protein
MDAVAALTDAEARYLAQIAEDCAACLGADAELLDLLRETDGESVRLIARYRLGKRVHESQGSGDTMLSAHEVLRARILFDRLQYGLSDYLERR